jgi:hypothetical protein
VEAEFSRQRLLSGVDLTVVLGLVLDGWDVLQAAVEPVVVEPVHPAERGEFEVVDAAPGPFPLGAFGLVEPDQALRLGVVVAVPDGPDRGERAGGG